MTKPRDTTHIRIKISTKAAMDKMLDGSSYDELIRKLMAEHKIRGEKK